MISVIIFENNFLFYVKIRKFGKNVSSKSIGLQEKSFYHHLRGTVLPAIGAKLVNA